MIDISISGLSKEFEVGRKILDGVTFQVDQGEPGSFFYAEVEFPTREAALAWEPGKWAGYLSREVTGQPGQSMAAYWLATRGHAGGIDAPAGLEK